MLLYRNRRNTWNLIYTSNKIYFFNFLVHKTMKNNAILELTYLDFFNESIDQSFSTQLTFI